MNQEGLSKGSTKDLETHDYAPLCDSDKIKMIDVIAIKLVILN